MTLSAGFEPFALARAIGRQFGGHQHHGLPRLVAPEPVAAVELRSGRDDSARLGEPHLCAVVLPGHRCGGGVGAHRLAGQAPVLDHVERVVVGEGAEVERLEHATADPAHAGRERDGVGAAVPANH